MADNSSLQIPLFTNINSNPIAPTATSGGNITYFYEQYNSLITNYDNLITTLETKVATLETQVATLEGYHEPEPTTVTETFPFVAENSSGVQTSLNVGFITNNGTLQKFVVVGGNDLTEVDLQLEFGTYAISQTNIIDANTTEYIMDQSSFPVNVFEGDTVTFFFRNDSATTYNIDLTLHIIPS